MLVWLVPTVMAVCFDPTNRGPAFGVLVLKPDDWSEPSYWQKALTEEVLLEGFRGQRNSVVAAIARPE